MEGRSQDLKEKLWSQIDTFFVPPVDFVDQYGSYRSPLRRSDNSMVESKEEWLVRRGNIEHTWHHMMGAWPPLITDQQLQILDSTTRENFTQFSISLQWTPNELTHGYLLVPSTHGPKPAVITLFYEPETAIGLGDKPHRDFAYQLAKRGFVTLSLGTTVATQAKTYALYYPSIENASVQPLSMLGYAAANAWHALALHPAVDANKIGVVGHSFGGKWAMFASCLFEKFACAVWSDPGIMLQDDRPSINYWEPWYLGYHPRPWRPRGLITAENPAKGLYPAMRAQGINLHELHALMAPRPFLVSGGSEDPISRWKALNHTVAINRILGHEHRVGMTNRPTHSPDGSSNEVIYLFFEYFLK